MNRKLLVLNGVLAATFCMGVINSQVVGMDKDPGAGDTPKGNAAAFCMTDMKNVLAGMEKKPLLRDMEDPLASPISSAAL